MSKTKVDASLCLFLSYAKDAGNWSGKSLVRGNVGGTKAARGNFTQLKQAGLITTERDQDNALCAWIYFTVAGVALAAEHGITL